MSAVVRPVRACFEDKGIEWEVVYYPDNHVTELHCRAPGFGQRHVATCVWTGERLSLRATNTRGAPVTATEVARKIRLAESALRTSLQN